MSQNQPDLSKLVKPPSDHDFSNVTPESLEVEEAQANMAKLDGPHEHSMHVIDEEAQALIAKGFVPERVMSPYGQQVKWYYPVRPTIPWQTVIVVIALLIFFLLIAWGAPWR